MTARNAAIPQWEVAPHLIGAIDLYKGLGAPREAPSGLSPGTKDGEGGRGALPDQQRDSDSA